MAKEVNNVPDNVKSIDDHLDNFFESEEMFVIHEKESETVHSDIYVIKPDLTKGRDYYILLTCGLAAAPMINNEKEEIYREIVMLLPMDWEMDYSKFNDENNWWPFRLLKTLTKYPHETDKWLDYGHTFTWGLDEKFSENNCFVGIVLAESVTLPEEFLSIEELNKSTIIYSAIPLYREELEFKMKNGMNSLLEKFDEFDVSEILDLNRVNTCQ